MVVLPLELLSPAMRTRGQSAANAIPSLRASPLFHGQLSQPLIAERLWLLGLCSDIISRAKARYTAAMAESGAPWMAVTARLSHCWTIGSLGMKATSRLLELFGKPLCNLLLPARRRLAGVAYHSGKRGIKPEQSLADVVCSI